EAGAHTAIEKFIERVSNIQEADYGDFMRKANLYLNDLKKDLSPYISGEEKKKIDEIQLHLQFIPTWEIEPTRKQVVDAAKDLESSP
ncbi:hypothetical protein KC217_21905, partial [Mycobacterium tuberculosis]|nr:hypothetical protein [Mycobacterium tuberculosis]